jgi:sec-independent protein translocase protein TatC
VFWGAAIYFVQQHIVNVLLRPAHGQHFIYTSVGGGIDFLFRICIYGGFILSLPVIVYNTLRFIEPLISQGTRRFIFIGSFISGLLAFFGIVFGYYIGLPAALHFLLHQFKTVQIQPLVTIQSYLHFVIVYMVGSALLFQLPLLLVFINRIKPLQPKRLLHYERWVILIAFVVSGLMNPTPNILSQLLVAGPFILMYQVGIGMIAVINRPKRPAIAEPSLQQNDEENTQQQSPPPTPLTVPVALTHSLGSSLPRVRPGLISDMNAKARLPLQPALQTRFQQPMAMSGVGSRSQQRFMDFMPSSRQSFAPDN